jgi:hypothetical protein
MRKNLRPCLLLAALMTVAIVVQGQQTDRFVYAITDVQAEGATWSYLRKLDLRTGAFSQVLLNGTEVNQVAYDAVTKKEIQEYPTASRYGFSTRPAFNSGVAAIAYDRRNNRLYYTPMFIDQLRYIDLKSMKVYYVTDKAFSGMADKASDQSNIITRMTLAPDGYGYAVTNDGKHLIRFSTGKNLTIENLGTLVDAPENKSVSIHNACSSYGGDMIADNEGNLYLFTARNNVYKVNIETKVATLLGAVKGLPANYTINGVAVDDQNRILASSAVSHQSWFIIDPQTLEATAYSPVNQVWRSSDLANGNVLNTKKSSAPPQEMITRLNPSDMGSNKIQVYPNPVVNNQFTITFSELETGTYTLRINDVAGRNVLLRNVAIHSEMQTESVKLDPASARGMYLITLSDRNNQTVHVKKIMVQ